MKIKVCGGNLSDKCWSQQDYWAWPRGHPGLPSSLVFCKPGHFHTHRASIFEVPACVEPSVPGCLLGNWLTAPKSQTKSTGQPGSPNYLLVNTALIFPMLYLYLFLYLGNQIPQIHPPIKSYCSPQIQWFSPLALSLVLDSDWQKIFMIFRIFRPASLSWYCNTLPCTVCNCASTANRWWQPITTPIFAIDGVAVFSLPLWWLCSPPRKHLFCPISAAASILTLTSLEMAFYRVIWRIL